MQFNIVVYLSSVIWTLPLSWILKVSYVRPLSLTTIRCAKYPAAVRDGLWQHSEKQRQGPLRITATALLLGRDRDREKDQHSYLWESCQRFWSGVALLAIAALPSPTLACTSTPSLRLFRGQLWLHPTANKRLSCSYDC